jgi:hypothetical protein
MYQNENIEKIMAIHRRCGEVQFRMALQHLIQMGAENFSDENMVAAKETIRNNTPKNAIMTADYQLQLLDCSFELSQYPVWDVLLYLKLYISIQNDDMLDLEEAEQALCAWNNISKPKEWRDAIEDPDTRSEILHEMVSQHITEYTDEEIRDAVRMVADEDWLASDAEAEE